MDESLGIHVIYDKSDIITDCKFCRKTEFKGYGSDYAYGYGCMLKSEKRNCNRCRHCYFGRRWQVGRYISRKTTQENR